jgi:hypothetical protein
MEHKSDCIIYICTCNERFPESVEDKLIVAINALRFYADRRSYSITNLAQDCEQTNETFKYAGKRARIALDLIGVK